MDAMDSKTAQQVWKRVAAPHNPGLSPGDLHRLMQSAAETGALYRSLAAALSGKQKDGALVLVSGQQDTVYALRGMGLMCFGREIAVKSPNVPRQNVRQILECCYRNAKEALTEYTARTILPEFGPVFRLLASREEENCLRILTLWGQL